MSISILGFFKHCEALLVIGNPNLVVFFETNLEPFEYNKNLFFSLLFLFWHFIFLNLVKSRKYVNIL